MRFYEFSDRIEITNPGGLFGNASAENFPRQNDYRNPNLAEVLKNLGYVNKFSRGVIVARADLEENGNKPPDFVTTEQLYFSVKIYSRPL